MFLRNLYFTILLLLINIIVSQADIKRFTSVESCRSVRPLGHLTLRIYSSLKLILDMSLQHRNFVGLVLDNIYDRLSLSVTVLQVV